MENSSEIAEGATLTCISCSEPVLPTDAYCLKCNYPLHGSDMEQKTFFINRDNLQLDIDDYNKKIKVAGAYLFILAALFVIAGLMAVSIGKKQPYANTQLILDLTLAVIFVILGFTSRKKPLLCLIAGLSIYVIVQLLNAIYTPASIIQGLIFKIIIIGFLIKGIKSAVEINKIQKEYNLL